MLDWLEKRRVFLGSILSLALLAIGGLLAWFDWHPPKTTITTSRTLVRQSVTKVEAQTKDVTTTASVPVASQSSLVNINTAGAAELDKLAGIGPALAQRIIDYRGSHGIFRASHDIVNVAGIGEAIYAKIQSQITLGD